MTDTPQQASESGDGNEWGLAPLSQGSSMALTRVAEGIMADPAGRLMPVDPKLLLAAPILVVFYPLYLLAWGFTRLMVGRFLLLDRGGWRWLRSRGTREYPAGGSWTASLAPGGMRIDERRVFGRGDEDFPWLVDTLTRLRDRPPESTYLEGPPGWEQKTNPLAEREREAPSSCGRILFLVVLAVALFAIMLLFMVNGNFDRQLAAGAPLPMVLGLVALLLMVVPPLVLAWTGDPAQRQKRLEHSLVNLVLAGVGGVCLVLGSMYFDPQVTESTARVRESFEIVWRRPGGDREHSEFLLLDGAPSEFTGLLCHQSSAGSGYQMFTPGQAWVFQSGQGLLHTPWYVAPEALTRYTQVFSLDSMKVTKTLSLSQVSLEEARGYFAPGSENLRTLQRLKPRVLEPTPAPEPQTRD